MYPSAVRPWLFVSASAHVVYLISVHLVQWSIKVIGKTYQQICSLWVFMWYYFFGCLLSYFSPYLVTIVTRPFSIPSFVPLTMWILTSDTKTIPLLTPFLSIRRILPNLFRFCVTSKAWQARSFATVADILFRAKLRLLLWRQLDHPPQGWRFPSAAKNVHWGNRLS